MRGILLINTAAWRIRAEPALADARFWKQRFRAAGVDVDVWTGRADELEAAAQEAARSSVDRVIVAGGDGTVRTAAEALVGTGKPLGVLPAGTINHFARDLGMPPDLDAALRAIAGGRVRAIDVGEVNGRVFVNNSSVGLYSQMVLLRDARRPRTRLGKFAAMLVAAARILWRFRRLRLTIRVNGDAVIRTVPLVLVSNNLYETGWPQLGRRVELSGGQLGLYVVRSTSRLDLLRSALWALWNRLDRIDSIEFFRTSSLSIESPRRTLPVSLDGEVLRLSPPLVYRSRPRELLVVQPQSVAEQADT